MANPPTEQSDRPDAKAAEEGSVWAEFERALITGHVPTVHRLPPDRHRVMDRWLSRAGCAHVDTGDISSRKNEYLPE